MGGEAMHATRTMSMARLVQNHSSAAPGLKEVLKRLAQRLPDTDTITPGRLAQTRGTRESFTLSFGAAEPPVYGFKLIARKGKASQEVFVVSQVPRREMEKHVAWCVHKVHGTQRCQPPNENAVIAAMRRVEALDTKLGVGSGAQKERADTRRQLVAGAGLDACNNDIRQK